MTQEMYVSPAPSARGAAQIGVRLAEELDDWVRAQESAQWHRFDSAGTDGSDLGAEEAVQ